MGGSSRGLGGLGSLSAWGRLKQCARYCAALRLPPPDNCPPSFGSLHWGVVGGLLEGTSFFGVSGQLRILNLFSIYIISRFSSVYVPLMRLYLY
jgi:hypothetical protein